MGNKLTIEKINEVMAHVQKQQERRDRELEGLYPFVTHLTPNQRKLKDLVQEKYGYSAEVKFE